MTASVRTEIFALAQYSREIVDLGRYTLVSLLPGADPMQDVVITAAARFHVYVEPN